VDELDPTIQPPSLDDQKAVLGQLTSYEAWVVASSTRVIEFVRTRCGMEMASPDDAGLSGLAPVSEVGAAQLESARPAAKEADDNRVLESLGPASELSKTAICSHRPRGVASGSGRAAWQAPGVRIAARPLTCEPIDAETKS
jgi:hypothetical protein